MPRVLGLRSSPPPPRSSSPSPPEAKRRRIALVMMVVSMVAATGGYAIYRAPMKTPSAIIADSNGGLPKLDMEALKKMGDANRQRALADYGRALAEARGSNTGPLWTTGAGSDPRQQEMRQMMSQLPDEDRRAVFKAMGERREVERREEIKAFFKLSPEEQRAELDKRLDAMADRQWAIPVSYTHLTLPTIYSV